MFADAEAVLNLGQADIGAPQFVGGVSLQVGAQQVAAVGKFGPIPTLVVADDAEP